MCCRHASVDVVRSGAESEFLLGDNFFALPRFFLGFPGGLFQSCIDLCFQVLGLGTSIGGRFRCAS